MDKINELTNRLRELFEDFYTYAFGPIVLATLVALLIWEATH